MMIRKDILSKENDNEHLTERLSPFGGEAG